MKDYDKIKEKKRKERDNDGEKRKEIFKLESDRKKRIMYI